MTDQQVEEILVNATIAGDGPNELVRRVEEAVKANCKKRVLRVLEWSINDYNRANIEAIMDDMRAAL